MSVTVTNTGDAKVAEILLSGRLGTEDYQQFVPAIENMVKDQGRVRLLVEMHDFHGWTAGALWQDIKFDARHFGDIDRLALVGEKKWQKGMAAFCKPFTRATVRYFDHADIAEARNWLKT